MVSQSSTNFPHDVINVSFSVDEEIGMPELGHNILARNQLPAPANEENQELHRFFLELYPAPPKAKLVAAEVELDIAQL